MKDEKHHQNKYKKHPEGKTRVETPIETKSVDGWNLLKRFMFFGSSGKCLINGFKTMWMIPIRFVHETYKLFKLETSSIV